MGWNSHELDIPWNMIWQLRFEKWSLPWLWVCRSLIYWSISPTQTKLKAIFCSKLKILMLLYIFFVMMQFMQGITELEGNQAKSFHSYTRTNNFYTGNSSLSICCVKADLPHALSGCIDGICCHLHLLALYFTYSCPLNPSPSNSFLELPIVLL